MRLCFVSENCRKDSISCFSRLKDQIESHWLDFIHGIKARIFWAASLQRISDDFGVKFKKKKHIIWIPCEKLPKWKINLELG